jgi:type VI secretion system protein ImpA
MPLSDHLLKPIPGENPSGANLRYDPIFQQLKELSSEGDQGGVLGGNFELAQVKKVDHRGVVRLATETLEKRSKDIQLAAYLTASMIRLEGFAVVAPSIDLLRQLQETFWPTLYPEPDEGEDYEMRAVSVEKAARGIAEALATVPLTSNGLTYADYQESRTVGYEKDATSDAKKAARKYAVDHGKLTAEEFDKAFAGSPKKLYLDGEAALAEALQAVDRLDTFQGEKYKNNEPSLRDLRSTVETVHQAVEYLLNERRKTEPDPVAVQETPSPGEAGEGEAPEAGAGTTAAPRLKTMILRARTSEGAPKTLDDAYAQVVESALFLFEKNPASPVPYLICAGLRTGETAMQGAQPAPGFAVGPDAEVRLLLRSLAASSNWVELLRQSLPILASECARGWLDLHRYVHKAGTETGAPAIAMAVQGTVKSLLTMRPELRNWILEDDTGAANPETQKWLDSL